MRARILQIIFLFLVSVRVVSAVEFQVPHNITTAAPPGGFRVKLVNPDPVGLAYERSPADYIDMNLGGGFTFRGRPPYSVWLPGNSETIVQYEGGVMHSGVIGTTHASTADFYLWGYIGSEHSWRLGKVAATFTIVDGGSFTATPVDGVLATIFVRNPPPSGKITLMVPPAGNGPRTLTIGAAAPQNISVSVGTNVVVQTNTPADYPDGALVSVKAGVLELGSGTIAKDLYGNFDLVITLDVPASVGIVIVNGAPALFGPGRLVTQGWEGEAIALNFNGSGEEIMRQTWDPATLVADGAVILAQWQKPSGEWQTVGSAVVEKAPDGSFALAINCRGAGDDPALGPNKAVFELDLVSYDPGAKTIQLKIGDTLYTATPSTVGGSPENGERVKLTVILDNTNGVLDGVNYSWVVSGTMDGQAVSAKTIATGTAPSSGFVDIEIEGAPAVDQSFTATASATIGSPHYQDPEDPAPPPSDYSPNAPPPPGETPEEKAKREEMKSNYDATRKAMEDALKSLGTGNGLTAPGSPSTGEADASTKHSRDAIRGINESVQGLAGGIAPPNVIDFTGSVSAVSLSFPIYGVGTLDLAVFDPWPGIIRAFLLGWWAWLASIKAIEIVKSAGAGK